MTTALSPATALRIYLTLSATRWLPVGFVLGTFGLLALERGLSVSQVTAYGAAQGIVVLLVELPSSALADVLGRKPVLLVAGVVNIAAISAYLIAHTFWAFAIAAALMGLFRALDSGPLDAWYVDSLHEHSPEADPAPALAKFGTTFSLALAFGAVLSGALVAWHPVRSQSALVLPVFVCLGLSIMHSVLVAILLRETPRPTGTSTRAVRQAFRRAPTVLVDSLKLLRHNRILAGLMAVEVAWVIGAASFESLLPLRFADLLGSPDRAGIWMGPASAAGWVSSAVGSWLVGRLMLRIGVVRSAIIARVLNGLTAATMGLMGGPLALATAFVVTSLCNGLVGAPNSALLHREATAANRATVLSLSSTVMFLSTSLLWPIIGWCAQTFGIGRAMVGAGIVSVLGVLGYLPSLQGEGGRTAGRTPAAE